ncbi:MAG: tetratricopeptide repeat protein [Desulfurivibrionaceae bacterium]
MNKNTMLLRIIPVTFAGIFILGGCATQQDMRRANLERRAQDSQIIELKKSIEKINGKIGESVNSVQKNQAGLGNTLDEMETTLLQTKGQLEESRHRYRSLNAELIRIKENLNERLDQIEDRTTSLDENFSAETSSLKEEIDKLDKKLATQQSGIETLNNDITSLDQSIKEIKKARMEEKAAKARRAAESARAKREQTENSKDESSSTIALIKPEKMKKEVTAEKETSQKSRDAEPKQEDITSTEPEKEEKKDSGQLKYEQGISEFEAANYREAKEIFSDLRKEYGSEDIGIKARFMVADCLFNLENYSLAILEYQQVISDHSGHKKVPHALYNQASAFEKMGDKKTADIVYRKVVREYPNSEEASKAKEKL